MRQRMMNKAQRIKLVFFMKLMARKDDKSHSKGQFIFILCSQLQNLYG
jgi:hypothetical protein